MWAPGGKGFARAATRACLQSRGEAPRERDADAARDSTAGRPGVRGGAPLQCRDLQERHRGMISDSGMWLTDRHFHDYPGRRHFRGSHSFCNSLECALGRRAVSYDQSELPVRAYVFRYVVQCSRELLSFGRKKTAGIACACFCSCCVLPSDLELGIGPHIHQHCDHASACCPSTQVRLMSPFEQRISKRISNANASGRVLDGLGLLDVKCDSGSCKLCAYSFLRCYGRIDLACMCCRWA